MAGWAAILVMAVTIPLSGSRSCTLLALLLFIIASVHLAWRIVAKRRRAYEPIAPPIVAIVMGWLFVFGGAWFVGRDTILARLETTRDQVAHMREIGGIGDRARLYNDTWRMAQDKIYFGWGMASYPHIFFRFYNTRESRVDRLPVFFNDAHSDWLQSLAEHGLAGSALLALCAVVPLWHVRRRTAFGPLASYVLIGCALVLLYAWIEFPFGNLAVVLVWWVLYFTGIQLARLRQLEDGAAVTADSGPRTTDH
jgi:O-antigen ligase